MSSPPASLPAAATKSSSAAAAAAAVPSITIAYWNIRGLAAPLRMIAYWAGLAQAGKAALIGYDAGDPASDDYKSSWFKGPKEELLRLNPMMNLPYLIDDYNRPPQQQQQEQQEGGGKKQAASEEAISMPAPAPPPPPPQRLVIVQTNAIIAHLGRVCRLDGDGDAVIQARIDQVLDQTMDLRNAAVKVFYSGGDQAAFDASAGPHLETTVQAHYAKLDGFLAAHGTRFAAADRVTVADFHLWEMIDQHEALAGRLGRASAVAAWPRLEALWKGLRAAPELREYFASPYYQLPLNNPHGVFR